MHHINNSCDLSMVFEWVDDDWYKKTSVFDMLWYMSKSIFWNELENLSHSRMSLQHLIRWGPSCTFYQQQCLFLHHHKHFAYSNNLASSRRFLDRLLLTEKNCISKTLPQHSCFGLQLQLSCFQTATQLQTNCNCVSGWKQDNCWFQSWEAILAHCLL